MNTNIHLSTIGAAFGAAGVMAASSIMPTAAMHTMKSALQNQNTITTYMSNQDNSTYTRHNHAHMDAAWNAFNPSKFDNDGDRDDAAVAPSSPLSHFILNKIAAVLHKIQVDWHSTNTNPTWTPSGTNWQADWSNWNPTLWEQNGSTYANWANQLGAYLSMRFPSFAPQIQQVGL